MFNAVFNTSVRHDLTETLTPDWLSPLTNYELTDSLLAPLHFLFNGRSVVLFQNNVVREDRSSVKTWVKVALVTTVIAFPVISGPIGAIPLILYSAMTLMGVTIRTFSLYFSEEERKTRKVIADFYQDPNKFEKKMPLALAQRVLEYKMAQLKFKMKNPDIWNNPAFIQEVDDYMKIAAIAMEQFFEDLEKLSKGKVQDMAVWLSTEEVKKEDVQSLKNDGMIAYQKKREAELLKMGRERRLNEENPLRYHFFNGSFFLMYHTARHFTYQDPNTSEWKENSSPNQAVYFTKGTPQYRWRTTFNALSKKFNDYKENDRSLRDFLIHSSNEPANREFMKYIY